MAIAIGIVVALILLSALAFIGLRNSLIAARNRCDEAWSGVEVQLKRRHDLVPNLVETVKGYASHERGVFEKTAAARAAAIGARGPDRAADAERQLSSALGELRAVAESYPQLRASENFQQLSSELAGIEDQIQTARRLYNSHTRDYNTKIQVFPNSLVARSGGFQPGRYFQIEDEADRERAAVEFIASSDRETAGEDG
jgi:LemA protein